MKVNDILLGLVALHPDISGYELKKIIEGATRYFVTIRLSQIYPALKKMADEGLLSYFEEITEGGRATKRYSLTEAGKEQLIASLKEPINFNMSTNTARVFLLRTTFIGLLSKEDQISFFTAGLEHYKAEREILAKDQFEVLHSFLSDEVAQKDSIHNIWNFEYHHVLEYDEMLIAWIEKVLASLKD
ncbi:MAG: PadR family transcriptional regulator [Anaerotardibacter sp.]